MRNSIFFQKLPQLVYNLLRFEPRHHGLGLGSPDHGSMVGRASGVEGPLGLEGARLHSGPSECNLSCQCA